MTVTKLAFIALVVCAFAAVADAQGRRVRLRPRPAQIVQDDQLQYYEAEPRAGDEDVVLVSPAEELNLYGRQSVARADNYIRPAVAKAPRTKEARAPPVQTIRNYNKVNDDGSFTFGYEAADGSFKEETRGTDCVVRGKYGYVDPDGNKREFTYVSGNPCDPNAPSEDDDPESLKDDSNEADEPANYPIRTGNYPTRTAANYPAARPVRPVQTTARPATTVFQNIYSQGANDDDDIVLTTRKPPSTPVAITPRPSLPATTFRPQLLQITQRPAVTARPPVVYSSAVPQAVQTTPSSYAPSRPAGHIDFAAEFAKFQQENQIISSTPSGFKTKSKVNEPSSGTGNPIYSTQLVFDPSNGVYNTQLFQSLPQGNGDFTLSHKVQPTVSQPQPQPQPQYSLQPQIQYNPPVYRHRLAQPAPQQVYRNPQEIYQRQQSELQYQNSQQLYAQQQQLQQSQLQQDRQAARAAALQQQGQTQPQQQFYYVAPGRESQNSPIDAFFRGQGLQF